MDDANDLQLTVHGAPTYAQINNPDQGLLHHFYYGLLIYSCFCVLNRHCRGGGLGGGASKGASSFGGGG